MSATIFSNIFCLPFAT